LSISIIINYIIIILLLLFYQAKTAGGSFNRQKKYKLFGSAPYSGRSSSRKPFLQIRCKRNCYDKEIAIYMKIGHMDMTYRMILSLDRWCQNVR